MEQHKSPGATGPRLIFEIEQVVGERKEADAKIRFAPWAIISILSLGIAGMGYLSDIVIVLLLGFISLDIASIYVVYLLMKREGGHLKRQIRLQDALVAHFNEKVRGLEQEVSYHFQRLQQVAKAMKDEGKRRVKEWILLYLVLLFLPIIPLPWLTPVARMMLWTPLIIPFIHIFAFHSLTSKLNLHNRRQRDFVESVDEVLLGLGNSPISQKYEGPRLPFAPYLGILTFLYLVVFVALFYGGELWFELFLASAVAVLLFSLYWMRTIVKEGNDHLDAQGSWEDGLLNITKGTVAEEPKRIFCPSCGKENKPTAKFCIACGTPLEE